MSRPELTLRLIPNPRTLLISSPTHVLLFRPSPNHHASASAPYHRPEVVVEFTDIHQSNTSASVKLSRCCGCLGLLELDSGECFVLGHLAMTQTTKIDWFNKPMTSFLTPPSDIFVAIATHTSISASPKSSGEHLDRILAVDFFCITSAAYDHYSSTTISNLDHEDNIYDHPADLGLHIWISPLPNYPDIQYLIPAKMRWGFQILFSVFYCFLSLWSNFSQKIQLFFPSRTLAQQKNSNFLSTSLFLFNSFSTFFFSNVVDVY